MGFKKHSNRVYLPLRPTLRRVLQGLSLLIQVQLKKHFSMHTLYELYKTHDSLIVLKIILSRRACD